MNKLFKILSITLTLTGLIFFLSCGPSRPKMINVNPAFKKYVSAYTSGMVSNEQSIQIELANEVPASILTELGKRKNDQSLLEDIIEIEPQIDGKLSWVNERTIEFTPTKPLPPNTFYTAYFNLEQVAEVEDGFESFAFQFVSYPMDLFVDNVFLEIEDEYNPEEMTLTGELTTSDNADSLGLTKSLYVLVDGKKLYPEIIERSWQENHYEISLHGIKRKEKEQNLELHWDAEPLQSKSKGHVTKTIPALGDFSLVDAKVIDNGDQFVQLAFSEPILSSQNLDGIISISGEQKLAYEVNGNEVKVFLNKRIVGERELNVTTGLQNIRGHKKLQAYAQNLSFLEPKPMVRIKGSGTILPNSQGLILPFEAVSLKSVQVRVIKIFENNVHHFLQVNNLDGQDELHRFGKVVAEEKVSLTYDKSIDLKQWSTHVIDLGKLIKPDQGAIYRVSIKFTKKDAICDCEKSDKETTEVVRERDDWNEDLWYYDAFDENYDSWYYYDDDYSPCDEQYYHGKAVSRNILASDLGVVFKLEENKTGHAFVTNMLTTEPVPNAEVSYYDFTKQVIASGKTDAQGMLSVHLKEKPFLLVVKNGAQRGYLKLGDSYSNAMNKFDIEGETVQKGVKGYLYAERGVWRPGDSIYVAFILENKDKLLPPNHPVSFDLQDPNGNSIYQHTSSKNVNGTYDFRCKTEESGLTGVYVATASVGNNVYTKYLKVETIKPNRLKIKLDVERKDKNDTIAKLSAAWLHGAIAKNLRATVQVQLSSNRTVFDNFKKYNFDSPLKSYRSDLETVVDDNLNEKGELRFSNFLNVGTNAPGKLKANYVTKVFESGGDFSIDRTQVEYSPFETYVGIQAPNSSQMDESLETDKKHMFDIVAVNEDGKLRDEEKLEVKMYKLKWRWWYENNESDLATYIARTGSFLIKDTVIYTHGGKAKLPFKIAYPEYGKYLIVVTDSKGHHQTGTQVTVDWPYWSRSTRTQGENANLLHFSTDKTNYSKGEEIHLSFPSPSDGKALVSIETRSKVLKKYWIKTTKGETFHTLTATEDMAPNAYIHITLIQPHASTKNDLPIRLYGVAPVMVDDPETHLHPKISMPDVLKPETTASITVSEERGKKMTYTLALVDDGLLDLTNFKTPQPWNTFYAKEALGVKTWDMYDYVIGAFAGKLGKLLTIGGDGEGNQGKNPKANRFKPMVKYIGPFTIEAGAKKTHQVEIPNYVGSVRVMVVAQNEGAYGNEEKTVAVRKPLMVLSSCPRVFGPEEEIALPISVFAMEKQVKNVKLTIETNDLLTVNGSKSQSFEVEEIGEVLKTFQLKVANRLGIAKIKIVATSGSIKAEEEIEVDVRASNPIQYESASYVLKSGASESMDLSFFGIQGSNELTVEVSTIPSIGLDKRLDYLIQYPHGCIEQTTSGAFPQLYLAKLKDLNDKDKKRTSGNIKAAINRIQLFQTMNGGFSYWPGESSESEWGTNYAGHFLLEAELQGYALPNKLKSKWVKYQTETAQNWNASSSIYVHSHGNESHQLVQAYRLYLLALSKNPVLGAMNRLKEEKTLYPSAKWQLASAYEEIGQHDVAVKLISDLPTEVKSYRELSYTYGSSFRDESLILQTLSRLGKKDKAAKLAQRIADKLNSSSWLNTQETAMSLLAMVEYTDVKTSDGKLSCTYRLNEASENSLQSDKRVAQFKYTDKDFGKKGIFKLKNKGKGQLFVSVISKGIPPVGKEKVFNENLNLAVLYKDLSGNTLSVDKLKQGTDFMVEVTVTNPGKKGIYKEMALTQLFPSGWEILNDRMDGLETQAQARYQDIRDDRVYSYLDLAPNSSKTIRLRLNASYLGKFYLPSVYCDAMYDHSIRAGVKGKWVEVVSDSKNVNP